MTKDERQGGKEKALPEITVTTEMIEAGLTEYAGQCPDTATLDAEERRMITLIIAAALSARARRDQSSEP